MIPFLQCPCDAVATGIVQSSEFALKFDAATKPGCV